MIITLYRGSERLLQFTTQFLPQVGELLWINDSTDNYRIVAIVYKINTTKKVLEADVMVV